MNIHFSHITNKKQLHCVVSLETTVWQS